MMRPGYQTTEFWLTLITSVWALVAPTVPPPYNVVVPMVAVAAYNIARGLAKLGLIRGDVGRELREKTQE